MGLLSPRMQGEVRRSLIERLAIGLKLREIEHRKLIAQAANVLYQFKEQQIVKEKGTAWASW
jgi:hypothetical protein